jgi:hypothetical protein
LNSECTSEWQHREHLAEHHARFDDMVERKSNWTDPHVEFGLPPLAAVHDGSHAVGMFRLQFTNFALLMLKRAYDTEVGFGLEAMKGSNLMGRSNTPLVSFSPPVSKCSTPAALTAKHSQQQRILTVLASTVRRESPGYEGLDVATQIELGAMSVNIGTRVCLTFHYSWSMYTNKHCPFS